MRISSRTRYGVRLMLELALRYGSGYIFLKDIAREQDISEKYLSQIVLTLKARGLIYSVRGAKGGHMLARPPSEITIGDITGALEGDPAIVDCVQNPLVCSRSSSCVVNRFWVGLQKQISDALSGTTLADLAADYGAGPGNERGVL